MQQIFQTLKAAQQAYRNNDQKEAIALLNEVVQQLPSEHLHLSAVQMAFGVVAILALLRKQAGEAQPPWLPETMQQLQYAVQTQQAMPAKQLEPLRAYLGELVQFSESPSPIDTSVEPDNTGERTIITQDAQHTAIPDTTPEVAVQPETSGLTPPTDDTLSQDDGTLMFLTSQIEALGAGPATVGMLLMRAEIYGRHSNWQAAITDYEAALAMSPDNAGLYVKLAAMYELAGAHEQAVAVAERALSLNPNDADRIAAQSVLERLQTYV
ncbi:MAG: hypothetical protein GFH27_549289n411 [Chloroflexi bacterium AL-W]|nr:hypothetical protein [Chloroflexi bacterium AL-N1]NOK67143.1 hypothetical protein [Chloroflexi bacterium AL-N10]NOK74564.1 hypothetical protein [Chloroflexi bacterium AL-N5]NOK81745.1 hypothetical protein [Chloroflexi bacterium AL-W]NOK89215.1 hypothetical protein [Chloroflexi bacterium AL-N15]